MPIYCSLSDDSRALADQSLGGKGCQVSIVAAASSDLSAWSWSAGPRGLLGSAFGLPPPRLVLSSGLQ